MEETTATTPQESANPEAVIQAEAAQQTVGDLIVRSATRHESGNSAMTGSHSATVLKLELPDGRNFFSILIDGSSVPLVSLVDPMSDPSGLGPVLRNVLSIPAQGTEIDAMESASFNSLVKEAIAAISTSLMVSASAQTSGGEVEGGENG